MVSVKKGKQTTESKVTAAIANEGGSASDMNIEALFAKVEAEGTKKKGNAIVSAASVREDIDKLFDSGRTSVPVAMLCHAINLRLGVASKDGVQNSSVRSAATAGKKYTIETIDGQAVIVRAPEVAPVEA